MVRDFIEFRGKREDNNEQIYGYYVLDALNKSRIYMRVSEESELLAWYFVKPESVEMFIGQYDKNGNKIYEGDKLDLSDCWWDCSGPASYDEPVCIVEWAESYSGFFPFANYDSDCDVYYDPQDMVIIDNN